MADGAAGRTQSDDHGPAPSQPWSMAREIERWPVSAVCTVAVLSVLVLLLVVANVLGLHVMGRNGGYDPETGGSVAEWFGALATLVALPAAVLFGIKQLQSSGDAIQLGQQQLAADEAERAERRSTETAVLRSALRVTIEATNVVDDAGLATDGERAAVDALRREYHQRGWASDESGASWQRGTLRRTNAEQLTAEPSPLLTRPWCVAVSCRNLGVQVVTVQRWTVVIDGRSVGFESPTDLAPGDSLRRRLGIDIVLDNDSTANDCAANGNGNGNGNDSAANDSAANDSTANGNGTRPNPEGAGVMAASHARLGDAEAVARRLTVLVDATDTSGRSVRIVHPPPD